MKMADGEKILLKKLKKTLTGGWHLPHTPLHCLFKG